MLTRNLELGSVSLQIKRLIEKTSSENKKLCWGFSWPTCKYISHSQNYIHTRTSTLLTSITAMQIDEASSEGTLVFIPACGQSIKKESCIRHPSCFAVLLKQHTNNQTHTHSHAFQHCYSSVAIAFFLLGYMFSFLSAFKITDVAPACLEDLLCVYRHH